MSDPIEEYIRANSNRFTRKAIRDELVRAGYDPAEIDRQWEAIQLARSAGDLITWAKALFWLGFVVLAASLVLWIWFVDALGSSGSSIDTPGLLGAALIVGWYAVLGYGVYRLTRWVAWRTRLEGVLSFAAFVGVFVAMAALTVGTCFGGLALTSG